MKGLLMAICLIVVIANVADSFTNKDKKPAKAAEKVEAYPSVLRSEVGACRDELSLNMLESAVMAQHLEGASKLMQSRRCRVLAPGTHVTFAGLESHNHVKLMVHEGDRDSIVVAFFNEYIK